MAKQDPHQRAKERYADAQDAMREQHARMLEDMRFSNPADPEQWPEEAKNARKTRPCLTFDRTNQFIQQVVNQARQNKPQIKFLPADSGADVLVADKLNGIMRHIEYVSRAGIAYDTSIDHGTRCGLGWLRVVPQIMRPDTNEQEIRILRVHDPLSVLLCDWTEPDGSDATGAFVETLMADKAFKAKYPKAKPVAMDGGRWIVGEGTKLCEYFEVIEEEENRIIADLDGQQLVLTEDEYWQVSAQTGVKLPFVANTMVQRRRVKWYKMTGAEILEETEFPSQYLPVIRVLGDELWIDGKRYLCGMVRKMMDSQRFHNYCASQAAETIALQPKAPFVAPARAIEGYENQWKNANNGSASYLPYNDIDDEGQPVNAPQRSQPPVMSAGWAEMMQYSIGALQASIGNFEANLGERGTAVSGRAKLADQRRGDTANFHYVDNLSRSMEQLGRVVVDMIPRIYDTKRQARIVGDDGSQSFVQIDPQMGQAVARDQGGKVVAINPGVGAYDVRVSVGPSYTSIRQEAAQNIVDFSQGNPQLGAALAPMLMKLNDMPEGDKAYKVALSLLPPQVQQAYGEGDEADIPPQVAAKMQQMQQLLQQAAQEMQQLQQALAQAEQDKAQGMQAEAMKAQAAQELELIRQQGAQMLQEMRDEAAYNRQELGGVITLLSKQAQPPQQLAASVASDIESQQ